MLVLSRAEGESVVLFTRNSLGLPQTIATIRVADVRGNRVRLVFDADKSVEIMRTEIVSRPLRNPKPRKEP